MHVLLALSFSLLVAVVRGAMASKPNIVLIMTDDQDLLLGSMNFMPQTQQLMAKEGTTYQNHFCTISICCPSRVSLLTGRAAHNTNVTSVQLPYGGYPKFITEGFNNQNLPVWLQQGGYNTYYIGKLMNSMDATNYNNPSPAGYTGSDFLIDPFMYDYLNSSWTHDQGPVTQYPGQHILDLTANNTYNRLAQAIASDKPFFLGVAPTAPHSAINLATFQSVPPTPQPQYADLFINVKVPRTENFNPNVPSSASWVKQLPIQNQTVVGYGDEFHRLRLRVLRGVDDIVAGVIQRLEKAGLMNNTYIIYTSDNGFHIGQHRMNPGKGCGLEEDIRVPFIVRGPGIGKNSKTDVVTTHTDIAPTIFGLADIPLRGDFDGSAIPLEPNDIKKSDKNGIDHVNVEYWGLALAEGIYANNPINNTYKGLRVINTEYSYSYTVWCTNEHELYDMRKDSQQMHNLATNTSTSATASGDSLTKLANRLDALLLVLKSCKGDACREPWRVLHPQGDVSTLQDALSGKFDSFYANQPKVSFSSCQNGYILSAEGPQVPNIFN